MSVDRTNYEEWALDFLEGTLSPEEHQAFVLFLEENPDLQEEFQGFEELDLTAVPVGKLDKSVLKRTLDMNAALEQLEAKTRLARPLIYLPHAFKRGLKKGPAYPWKKIVSIAASLTLLVSLGTGLLNTPNGDFAPRTPDLDIRQEKVELMAIPATEVKVVKQEVRVKPKAPKTRTRAPETLAEVHLLTPKKMKALPTAELARILVHNKIEAPSKNNLSNVRQVGNYLFNNPDQIPAVALGLGKKLLEERSWYKRTPTTKEFDLGFVRIKRS